jgi:hypothetical protein
VKIAPVPADPATKQCRPWAAGASPRSTLTAAAASAGDDLCSPWHPALPRATQAAWIIAVAQQLQPLVNLMDERLRSSGYIRIDETPVQVLTSEKSANREHWMWIRVAGPSGQRLILFEYDASRGSQVAERLLEGAHGYVQSDGYAAYDAVAARLDLKHAGCFAHARRRLFEAIQALPKSEQKANTAAHEIVRRIDALYTIGRDIKTMSAEARVVERLRSSVPLLGALHDFASSLLQQTLPSGKLVKALAYLLKQWPKLIHTSRTVVWPSIPISLRTRFVPSHWVAATGHDSSSFLADRRTFVDFGNIVKMQSCGEFVLPCTKELIV